jgi:UDP-GlcNAc:undecaprenyl-phosphate GlcNAc-1-phosphate transferase
MATVPAAIVALVLTLALAPPVLWLLRRHDVVDVPNERSSHQLPTVRGGGLAVLAAATVALLLAHAVDGTARTGVLLVALAMGLIGLADDLLSLRSPPRLVAQFVVAVVALPWLAAQVRGPIAWVAIFSVGTVLWLVGYVNAFNFMDGINGMAAAQVVVAGGAWWLIGRQEHAGSLATAGLIVAAAGLGFLPFNAVRPRMFLGDVGSYFLGGWLAACAMVGLRSGLAPEAVLAPLVVFGADTVITLIGRIRRHEDWHHAHREHVYQRLVVGGWSHLRTSGWAAGAMAACAAFGALSLTGSLVARAVGDILVATVAVGYLLSPRLVHPLPT